METNQYCNDCKRDYEGSDCTTCNSINTFAQKVKDFYDQPGMLQVVKVVSPITRDFLSGLERKA